MYVYEFVWVLVPICTQRQEDWQIPLELELYPSICRTPRLFHRFWSPTPSLHECGACAFTYWGICPAQFYSIILSHALDTKDCLMAFHYRSLSLLFGIGFFFHVLCSSAIFPLSSFQLFLVFCFKGVSHYHHSSKLSFALVEENC